MSEKKLDSHADLRGNASPTKKFQEVDVVSRYLRRQETPKLLFRAALEQALPLTFEFT